MLKAILWDFDGTIVDSLKHHLTSWRRAFAETGIDLTDEEIIQKVFYQFGEEKDPRYKLDPNRLNHYYRFREEALELLELHQHVNKVLEHFHNLGLKMSIISFSEKEAIEKALKRLGIDRYFNLVLGNKQVTKVKPDPEIAFLAMDKLGVKPTETLLIGDTNHDIQTGKNAGTMTALYLPETNLLYNDIDLFRLTNPDFEFESFEELIPKIERFLS